MATENFADEQDKPKFTYRPSGYKFTDPIRLFKANDPYYWEVDNIPLSQLQSNILWLKDQVGSDANASGIGRKDLNELQPFAAGGKVVGVRPGNYIARINDAYKTGISTLAQSAAASVGNTAVKSELTFTLPDSVLRILIGETTTASLGDHGLYDHLQHHVTGPITGGSFNVDWNAVATSFTQNQKSGINNIPKLKLALWKQASTVNNFQGDQVDLQQLSVEFTRRWGAPFRTAVVNVEDQLSIEVPSFSDEDYANNSDYVPSTRIDLLFIYSKPIDASSTAIAKSSGSSPAVITSPQLGLVKGAGVIALNAKGGAWGGQGEADKDFLDSDNFQDKKTDSNLYFEASAATDLNGNTQIISPLGDQNQTLVGLKNTFGNFPSPDDLMNLAPYITNSISSNNLALVGQSVLPVAYVVVRRDATTVEKDDIIDIRPFFRTAELTYNERAGIGAANPPLSMANPAVGKAELHYTARQLRDYVLANQNEVPQYSRPVGAGVVFGGLKWGPENVILRMASDSRSPVPNILTSDQVQNSAAVLEWFKQYANVPQTATSIPLFPDWEIAHWAQNRTSAGLKRNDYVNMGLTLGNKNIDGTYDSFTLDDTIDSFYGTNRVKRIATSWSKYVTPGGAVITRTQYVRKRINIDRSNVPWMAEYDVDVRLLNCAPITASVQVVDPDNGARHTGNPVGVFVEKAYDYFYIYVFYKTNARENIGDYAYDWGEGTLGLQNRNDTYRDFTRFPGFTIMHQAAHYKSERAKTHATKAEEEFTPQAFATYPSVSFNVIGYPGSLNYATDLGNNDTLILGS